MPGFSFCRHSFGFYNPSTVYIDIAIVAPPETINYAGLAKACREISSNIIIYWLEYEKKQLLSECSQDAREIWQNIFKSHSDNSRAEVYKRVAPFFLRDDITKIQWMDLHTNLRNLALHCSSDKVLPTNEIKADDAVLIQLISELVMVLQNISLKSNKEELHAYLIGPSSPFESNSFENKKAIALAIDIGLSNEAINSAVFPVSCSRCCF